MYINIYITEEDVIKFFFFSPYSMLKPEVVPLIYLVVIMGRSLIFRGVLLGAFSFIIYVITFFCERREMCSNCSGYVVGEIIMCAVGLCFVTGNPDDNGRAE